MAAITRAFGTLGEVHSGDRLPELQVPLTRTLIVATAIASRDYQDVHHDEVLAREHGMPSIFMNILTTNGFVGRYITDWAGRDAVIRRIAIRLGAPNFPGDTMRFSGTVTSVEPEGDRLALRVDVVGANSMGDHVTGTVDLTVPVGVAG